MTTTDSTSPGKTTVAPDVIATIAQLVAMGVPGVSRLASIPARVRRLFRRGTHEGVLIEIRENIVFVELYLIYKQDVNIREVSRNVQQQVARAIQEMVGMEIGHIDIHIEDIDYEETPEA